VRQVAFGCVGEDIGVGRQPKGLVGRMVCSGLYEFNEWIGLCVGCLFLDNGIVAVMCMDVCLFVGEELCCTVFWL
jgi:hypothetical protein